MNATIVKFRHYGLPFLPSEHAVLIVTGIYHHYVWLK